MCHSTTSHPATLYWGRKISRLEPCARLTAYSSSKQTTQEPSHRSFTSCAGPVTHLRRPSASLSTSSRFTTEPRISVEGDSTSWHTTKRLSCRIRIVQGPRPTGLGGRQLPVPSASGESRRYVGYCLGSTRQSLAPSALVIGGWLQSYPTYMVLGRKRQMRCATPPGLT